jgi:hypothetical protein
MSRLDTIKEQFPELNISFIDIFAKLDNTKSYKYLPILCKLFGKRYNIKNYSNSISDRTQYMVDLTSHLSRLGIDSSQLTSNEIITMSSLVEHFNSSDIEIFQEFKNYMERGLLDNKDVTSYQTLGDISHAVSLASMKAINKEMEGQVHIEYEDDQWLILRPLTFAASSKYGAGTKWCTTYKKEKSYFEKYWRNGALIYFNNKKTGYKFAAHKQIFDNAEISFWTASDHRTEFLHLDLEDYMLPVVRKIFKTKQTNKELCSDKIISQVELECLPSKTYREEIVMDEPEYPIPMQEIEPIRTW